jgi:pimeloyl-ACP methyl ester carboxylesterase
VTSPLWCEEVGPPTGPFVVLVHGSMDRAAGVVRVARHLRDMARVVIYDRRGYGRSVGAGPPFTMARHADDLAGLIGDRTAAVFGHSMGGNVALAAATRHPDRVRAVAVYESPASWLPWWPRRTAGGAAMEARPEDAAEQFLRRMIGDDRWEELPPRIKAARRAEGPALVGELVDVRDRAPFSVAEIDASVVVVRGELASRQHMQGADALAALFGVEPIVVLGAGHRAPVTHAAELAALVRRELLR